MNMQRIWGEDTMGLIDRINRVHIAVFFDEGTTVSSLDLATAIRKSFITVFPEEPQLIPLPVEAPKEVPRCIFQKKDGDASITFGLSRLDYDAGIKEKTDWKNHIEIVAYSFMAICQAVGIQVARIGFVIQTSMDEETIKMFNGTVNVSGFSASDEKSLSWVVHEKLCDDINVNINSQVRYNINDVNERGIVSIDVNTHKDSIFPKKLDDTVPIIQGALSKIEGRLKNVFQG